MVCKHKVPLNDYCFDCKVEKYPLVDGRDTTEPPLNQRAVRKTDKPKRVHKQLKVYVVVTRKLNNPDWQVYTAGNRGMFYTDVSLAEKDADFTRKYIGQENVKVVTFIWRQ
jgi:hypothetical protein